MSNYNSETTRQKQDGFEKLIKHHINICLSIFNKPYIENKTYQYIDTFAGPGKCNDNLDGSPLVFKRIALDCSVNIAPPYFFELDKSHAHNLQNEIGDFGVVQVGNSKELVHKLTGSSNQYGLAYLDPYGGEDLYYDAIESAKVLAYKYPKLDIVLNVNATSIKRPRGAGHHDIFLIDMLDSISKQDWIISEPYGQHQWAFAIGTNWADWAKWEKAGFFKLESEDGQEILTILNFTKNENPEVEKLIKARKKRRNGQQLPLF
mgnify:CR=1 FL=1